MTDETTTKKRLGRRRKVDTFHFKPFTTRLFRVRPVTAVEYIDYIKALNIPESIFKLKDHYLFIQCPNCLTTIDYDEDRHKHFDNCKIFKDSISISRLRTTQHTLNKRLMNYLNGILKSRLDGFKTRNVEFESSDSVEVDTGC